MLIAILTTMGIMIATVPVLLTNAPIKDVTTITNTKRRVSLLPARRMSLELIIFANPVWNMAPPTTNSPTIIMTTVLEKPARASSGVRMSSTMSAASAHSATMSERIFPVMKNTIVKSRMTNVSIIFLGGFCLYPIFCKDNDFAPFFKTKWLLLR